MLSELDEGGDERRDRLWRREEHVRGLLAPLEPYLVGAQRVLTWERPLLSAALLVTVNLAFWLATTWRLFSLIGLVGLVYVLIEVGVTQIWPCLQHAGWVSDGESWTEVHPHLLGVPELSHLLARYWLRGEEFLKHAVQLRVSNRAKFFVSSVSALSALGILGMYLPGIYVSYFIVMAVLLYPAARQHGLIAAARQCLAPVADSLERKLYIKRASRTKRGSPGNTDAGLVGLNESRDEGGDSEEEGMAEFLPSPDPLTLHRATLDDTPGGDGGGNTPRTGLTPQPPASQDEHSCDQSDDELLSDETLPHFARGLGPEMPSFRDDLESLPHPFHLTVDEMPSFDAVDQTLNSSLYPSDLFPSLAGEGMRGYLPTHFREPSPSDDSSEGREVEALTRGLSFDEENGDDPADPCLPSGGRVRASVPCSPPGGEGGSVQTGVTGVLADALSRGCATLASVAAASPSVAGVLATTASGLGRAVMGAVGGAGRSRGGEGDARGGQGGVGGEEEMLEEEFEFLDREELEVATDE